MSSRCRWIAVAVVSVALAGCGRAESSAKALLDDLGDGSTTAFVFVDRPDGSELLGCVAGVEPVRVAVDLVAGVATIGPEHGEPVAWWTTSGSLIARRALTGSGDDWVHVARHANIRDAVTAAVGPSASEYVFADKLPASPTELARAASRFTREVSFTEVDPVRMRVVVDAEAAAKVDASIGAGFPILEFEVAAGRVEAVSVRPEGNAGGFGFTLDFVWAPTPSPLVAPVAAADLASVFDEMVRRVRPTCSIGAG